MDGEDIVRRWTAPQLRPGHPRKKGLRLIKRKRLSKNKFREGSADGRAPFQALGNADGHAKTGLTVLTHPPRCHRDTQLTTFPQGKELGQGCAGEEKLAQNKLLLLLLLLLHKNREGQPDGVEESWLQSLVYEVYVVFFRDGMVGVNVLVKYTSQKKRKEVRSENKSEEETDSP